MITPQESVPHVPTGGSHYEGVVVFREKAMAGLGVLAISALTPNSCGGSGLFLSGAFGAASVSSRRA